MERKRARLDMVRKAIEAVLSGAQSYQLGSRSVTRANLAELNKMERDLTAEICVSELGDGQILGVRVSHFDRR